MWQWALPVPSCPLHNEGRCDHGSLSACRPLPSASAFQCSVPHRPKALWQEKHCGSTDPRLLTQTAQAAEGTWAALPQIFLVGTSLPNSIHHSQASPQTFSQGENVRGHTYMVFFCFSFFNNTVIFKTGLPRLPGRVHTQSSRRFKLFSVGLCVLGLLQSCESKNTAFSHAVSFPLFCIFLTMSYCPSNFFQSLLTTQFSVF